MQFLKKQTAEREQKNDFVSTVNEFLQVSKNNYHSTCSIFVVFTNKVSVLVFMNVLYVHFTIFCIPTYLVSTGYLYTFAWEKLPQPL